MNPLQRFVACFRLYAAPIPTVARARPMLKHSTKAAKPTIVRS
jgi:hypothetical protein